MFSSKPTTTFEALSPFVKVRNDLRTIITTQQGKTRELTDQIAELEKQKVAAEAEESAAKAALMKMAEMFPIEEKTK